LAFSDVVALASAKREVMLYAHLRQSVHLIRFAPPVIELRLEESAPRDFAHRLAALLEAETHHRWTIALSHEAGAPTIEETESAASALATREAKDHPLVQAIMQAFPGARIEPQRAAVTEQIDEPPPDWADFSPPSEAYFEEDGGSET
jgi:DNA polymerase-3 subunit gamma/tau